MSSAKVLRMRSAPSGAVSRARWCGRTAGRSAAAPPPADGGAEPGQAEGDVRQLAAPEEPAAANLLDAAVGGGKGGEAGPLGILAVVLQVIVAVAEQLWA